MKPLCLSLLIASLGIAADSEKPIEFAKEDLAVLWKKKQEDQDAVLKKYDGKLLKLSGEARDMDGPVLEIRPRPKGVDGQLVLALKFTDHPSTKDLAKRIRQSSGPFLLTVYGRASFSRQVEQPTKEYVIPPALRPKKGTGTVDPAELGNAINENNDRIAKIIEDARKKKQTEIVTVYRLFSLNDVVTDLKNLPKK